MQGRSIAGRGLASAIFSACLVLACGQSGGSDAPSPCGNGALDPGEECDNGASNGSGACKLDCTWRCSPGLAGDDDCDDHLVCNGRETCGDDHLCHPGAPAPDGTKCGPTSICASGACAPAATVCGDGIVVAPAEECDLGSGNGANKGCEATCRFSCVSSDAERDCQPVDACSGAGTCNDGTHVCSYTAPLADGTPCGTEKTCQSGKCTDAYCGNGRLDTGEECDSGNPLGGPGCEANCKHTCLSTDATRNCSQADICKGTSVCDDVTHTCSTPTPLPDKTECGENQECTGGTCVSITCGNNKIDPGEECDPPNGTTCDTACKKVVCDLTGTWALRSAVNVTWAGGLILASGNGQIRQWARVTMTHAGATASTQILACAVEIPDWKGSAVAGSELYGLVFPNSLFDQVPSYLTPTSTTATVGVPAVAGATFTTPAFASLIGATLTNPTTDPWPSSYTGVTSVDEENDGAPGVSLPVKSGGTYKNVPLDLSKSARADILHLALRQVDSYAATVDSCDQISGSINVTRVDSHVLGCHVAGTAQSCNGTQTTFLDNNRVKYTVGSATVVAKRVAPGASCAAIRAAVP